MSKRQHFGGMEQTRTVRSSRPPRCSRSHRTGWNGGGNWKLRQCRVGGRAVHAERRTLHGRRGNLPGWDSAPVRGTHSGQRPQWATRGCCIESDGLELGGRNAEQRFFLSVLFRHRHLRKGELTMIETQSPGRLGRYLQGFSRLDRLPAALIAGLAIGGVTTGVAYATIPDSSGLIHGCVVPSGGSLRIIDSGKMASCPAGDSSLNWAQTGPQGNPGAQGPRGVQGNQGSVGPVGTSGLSGYVVAQTTISVSPGAFVGGTASCPVVGSPSVQSNALDGGESNTTSGDIRLSDSYPTNNDTQWVVDVINKGSVTHTVTVYTTCAAGR